MSFIRDLRVAFHSLTRTPGLAIAVILTLALGIGANAAIFTLVRGVLLKPLVNRDENRLIYIRQSAPGIGDENSTFSVPEIQDLRSSVKTVSAFGDFSTMDFTMIGLGEPRSIRGGVGGGNWQNFQTPADWERAGLIVKGNGLTSQIITIQKPLGDMPQGNFQPLDSVEQQEIIDYIDTL